MTYERRWKRPLDAIRDLQDELDRFFRSLRRRYPESVMHPEFNEPCVDLEDRDGELYLCADLPGSTREDIKVNVTEDSIDIHAELRREKGGEKREYIRRERTYRGFHRSLSLPAKIRTDRVKAKYKNGVLEVHMPKVEVAPKGVRIEIE